MFRRPWSLALTLLTLMALSGPALSQDEKKKDKSTEVSFETFDGVRISGTYYTGGKGNNSPVAMLLHDFGQDRTKGDWDSLAQSLQKQGFAVLSFDFRGHGQSTEIRNPMQFWNSPNNMRFIQKANAKNTKLNHKEFLPAYSPMLLYDISAARKFLDLKNDAGECNMSNFFIIGAGQGAGLGFMWSGCEWQRNNALVIGQVEPGGRDVAGTIWLSMNANVNKSPLPLPDLLKQSKDLRDKTPMLFLYGDTDPGKTETTRVFGVLKGTLPAEQKVLNPQSRIKSIPNTKLAGPELLGKAQLDTEGIINTYVEAIVEKRGGEVWKNRKTNERPPETIPFQRLGIRTGLQ